MRILVVDDSRVMRSIVIRTLRQAGYGEHATEQAGDGPEALAAIRRDPPDLVLCDVHMPQMSGVELLRTLRASGSRVPFGFVTSESSDEVRRQAVESGAAFLLAKPFTAETFRQALDPLLNDAPADLPGPKPVREVLTDLLGRPVEIAPTGGAHLDPREQPATVAVYVDEHLAAVTLTVADLPLTAALGAAIGLLPPAAVEDAVTAGAITGALADNVREVLNVLAGPVAGAARARLRLYSVHPPQEKAPSDALAWAGVAGRRVEYAVQVGGYGGGRLAFVLAPAARA